MGLLMGIILYPSINETPRHRYIVWGCRVLAVPLIIMAFVLTTRNFCEYLSTVLPSHVLMPVGQTLPIL